jgi:hypothetical protein
MTYRTFDGQVSEKTITADQSTGRVGRPSEMSGGRRVQVYLDADSIARAETLGSGNVSAGIRAALAQHPLWDADGTESRPR